MAMMELSVLIAAIFRDTILCSLSRRSRWRRSRVSSGSPCSSILVSSVVTRYRSWMPVSIERCSTTTHSWSVDSLRERCNERIRLSRLLSIAAEVLERADRGKFVSTPVRPQMLNDDQQSKLLSFAAWKSREAVHRQVVQRPSGLRMILISTHMDAPKARTASSA